MNYYQFKPFNEHIDYGFGGYANAFKHAADDLLKKKRDGELFLDMHLPINYLYRHSIELYLKSIIIILHRTLQIKFGKNESDDFPQIRYKGKWKNIDSVHWIKALFDYFMEFVHNNRLKIRKYPIEDLLNPPETLVAKIEFINNIDKNSTYLRYPDIRNQKEEAKKSAIQRDNKFPGSIKISPVENPQKIFLEFDENDDITNSYVYNRDPFPELSQSLKNVADIMESTHHAIRMAFAQGES